MLCYHFSVFFRNVSVGDFLLSFLGIEKLKHIILILSHSWLVRRLDLFLFKLFHVNIFENGVRQNFNEVVFGTETLASVFF